VLSWMFKPQDIAIGDEWNGITLCAVSVAAAVFQRRLRFRALSQARRIRYLSETDVLTGTRNRNMFEEMALKYPSMCARTLTCVYADANGLHALNDTKGHKAGDVMLQTIAKALLDHFGSGHVYRVGGDEFVAFALDTPHESVEKDMKRMTAALARQGYDLSVGIASGAQDAIDMEALRVAAEKEMYREKERYYRQPDHERRKQ